MILVACAVVASFKVVGSILVIAMIICPAASARMLTDRLIVQLVLSAIIAVLCAASGYVLGAFVPLWLGYENSLSASGMMAVVAGLTLACAVVFAPSYGVLARSVRQWKLALNMRCEDILALLYRAEEAGKKLGIKDLQFIFGKELLTRFAFRRVRSAQLIEIVKDSLSLSSKGQDRARGLIRTHRLWETYLVNELGLVPDHVHDIAERLEHFTGDALQLRVAQGEGSPDRDPHGKAIPK